MTRRGRNAALPRDVISLKRYSQLDFYLAKFSVGELGLLLLLGRHGTGKSEAVKRALGVLPPTHGSDPPCRPNVLYIEGHAQPFGLYQRLWEHRDLPVILDDLDRLYADPDCVRLLKPLCNTEPVKRLTWVTNLTFNERGVPSSFTTTSGVVLVANEWRTINPNVRALEDRAIILHFDPSNAELHRRVGEWFTDTEVYRFMGQVLPSIKDLSMRHYCKGAQLRRAGVPDWRTSLVQMVIPDPRLACVVGLEHDPTIHSEQERVERFTACTGSSRATYYRIKARLPRI